MAMAEWNTGKPPKHGYFLGAWKRGGLWTVSELWFNPDSTGTGWWASRGYLDDRNPVYETLPVEVWMPMPVYEGGPEIGGDFRVLQTAGDEKGSASCRSTSRRTRPRV